MFHYNDNHQKNRVFHRDYQINNTFWVLFHFPMNIAAQHLNFKTSRALQQMGILHKIKKAVVLLYLLRN